MSIDVSAAASSASASAASATTAATPSKSFDKETFLALLVAQLRNQDPSDPMDSGELMTQTTQLSTMEQLTELTSTSRESFALQMRMAAAGLVGQTVTYVDDKDVVVTGVVRSVAYAGSVPTVTVGDAVVPLDSISTVTAPVAPTTPVPTPEPTPTPTPSA